MSSNRLIYDKCAYATEIKESTGSLEYNLFKGKYDTCEKCEIGDFPAELEFGPRADTESELHGLTRPNTKCPSLKYDMAQGFQNPSLTPAKTCENIYYITPNNLEKPTSNMLNEKNLAVDTRKKEQFGNQRYVAGNYPFESVQYQKENFGNQHYMPGDYPFNSLESQFKTQTESAKEMFGNQMYRPADYPFDQSNNVAQPDASTEASTEASKERFGNQLYMPSFYPASEIPLTKSEIPDAYGIEAHAPWNMNVKEHFDCGSWVSKKDHEQFTPSTQKQATLEALRQNDNPKHNRTAAGQTCTNAIKGCTTRPRPSDCLKLLNTAKNTKPGPNANANQKACWNAHNQGAPWLEQFTPTTQQQATLAALRQNDNPKHNRTAAGQVCDNAVTGCGKLPLKARPNCVNPLEKAKSIYPGPTKDPNQKACWNGYGKFTNNNGWLEQFNASNNM
jgi:hypothetical protein